MDQWRLYLEKIIQPDHKLMGPAQALDQLHIEDGGQLPFGEVRPGAPGRVYDCPSPLLPPPGAAGRRHRLPAAGDRHCPAPGDLLLPSSSTTFWTSPRPSPQRQDPTVRTAAVLLLDYLARRLSVRDIIQHALRAVPCADCRSLTLLRDLALRTWRAASHRP